MEPTSNTRWWDLPAASLLLVALITAATRLVVTGWTDELNIVQDLVIFGAIAGLALGQSRFPGWLCTFFSLAYGTFFVPWEMGRLMGNTNVRWNFRLEMLADRIQVVIREIVERQTVTDSIVFVVVMAILFWLISISAGYALTRHGAAWWAILPAGFAIFVIHSFDLLVARRSWHLVVYLFFAIVLVARMHFLAQYKRWQNSHTALPPNLGLDFIRFTLLAAGVLVIFAWTTPALAKTIPAAERAYQTYLREPWDKFKDRIEHVFASLQSTVGSSESSYGDSVLLGRGNRLTDDPVLTIELPEDLPTGVKFYWHGRVYDSYSNGRWTSTGIAVYPFYPEKTNLSFETEKSRWIGEFSIWSYDFIGTLYSPGQPEWFSRSGRYELVLNPSGTVDISAFRASPSLAPGQIYTVRASLSQASVAEMRQAGTDYPDWVTKRYLQLPSTITDKTKKLAQDLTANLDNPYDKVVAITDYLRNNITYQDTIPSPPARQDSIDWFLFDLQKGFCNYYASSEIVMLRSLGIPARFAIGFATGELQPDGRLIIRQRDAHAWPEVYFPNLGWVEFEPTSSQPAIYRLPGETTEGNPNPPNPNDMDRQRRMEEDLANINRDTNPPNIPKSPLRWLRPLTWFFSLAAVAAMLWFAWQRKPHADIKERIEAVPIYLEQALLKAGIHPPGFIRRWAVKATLPRLSRAYLEINSALGRIGLHPAIADTPGERALSLGQALPEAKPHAGRLAHEYQVSLFSQKEGNALAAVMAGKKIRNLSIRAMFRHWLKKLREPRKILRL